MNYVSLLMIIGKGKVMNNVQLAVQLMVQLVSEVMPVALVFGFSNLLINTVLSAAFGGKLKIGG